jgi:hypothetical protein
MCSQLIDGVGMISRLRLFSLAKAKLRAMWSSTRRQQQFRAMANSRQSCDEARSATCHLSIQTVFLTPCLAHLSASVCSFLQSAASRSKRKREDCIEYQYRQCLQFCMSSVGAVGNRPFWRLVTQGMDSSALGLRARSLDEARFTHSGARDHHGSFPVVQCSKLAY